ncbi:MAG: DUF1611 domain-containing protein [Acidobacteriota bacterium]|nr:DUF1611 domain-containing protein [Acidobacteriota bacterium]
MNRNLMTSDVTTSGAEQTTDARVIVTDEVRATLKCGHATRLVLPEQYSYATLSPSDRPQVGDIILARIAKLGRHTKIDDCDGRRVTLFEGDLLTAVYGNRYATDQYEGRVPQTVKPCHILSQAAVCGEMKSKHASMPTPTELEVVGFMHDAQERRMNLRDFGLPLRRKVIPPIKSDSMAKRSAVIVVVGSSMNSGKTMTTASVVRGLTLGGYRVAAGKITGTACGNDTWAYKDNGAIHTLDFSDCGFPSTYLCDDEEVMGIYRTLRHQLTKEKPDFIVMEIADSIIQRETRRLLERQEFKESIDHLLFAAGDSLAAESGLRWLNWRGYKPGALSGLVSASPLAKAEAEELTGTYCYTREEIIAGKLNELLKPVSEPNRETHPGVSASKTQSLPTEPLEWR